jgi:WD40 repeat protein
MKNITFLLAILLSNVLCGMDVKQRSIIEELGILPKEIKDDIASELVVCMLGYKEWWYLDKIFDHNFDPINAINYHPSGKHLVLSERYGKVRMINMVTQKCRSFDQGNWIFFKCNPPSGKRLTIDGGIMRIFHTSTQTECASFNHSGSLSAVCCHPSGMQLATASCDNKVRIFTQYTNYTAEQLVLKKLLLTWLLIEKPDKKINSSSALLADVAVKFGIQETELIATWKSFPESLSSALWRTMQYKIQKYGKNKGLWDVCSIF